MIEVDQMFSLPRRLTLYREIFPRLKEREIFAGYIVRKLNRLIATQEAFIMPGKAVKTGKKRDGFETTFVNFKLTGKDKDTFTEYFQVGGDKHSKDIVEMMAAGVKFSFSEQREWGIALASATMRDEGSVNYNRCITSRSGDWYEALMMCVYKIRLLDIDRDWFDQAGSDDWG